MALIFLSYRRTDAPQACRIHEWLARRLGEDALFMDVLGIPIGVDFSEHIRAQIAGSKLMLAVIGRDWQGRIVEEGDTVRMEIETAMADKIPVLPVLIGTTPMPGPDDLPPSIRTLALQNAVTVGVLHDFDTHMRALLPRIEAILGALPAQNVVSADPWIVSRATGRVVEVLRENFDQISDARIGFWQWELMNVTSYQSGGNPLGTVALHRTIRLADLLELHLLLSFWSQHPSPEQLIAGWVLRLFESQPLIDLEGGYQIKMRLSDEDPRQVWKMVSDQTLQLSLCYVATVSATNRG